MSQTNSIDQLRQRKDAIRQELDTLKISTDNADKEQKKVSLGEQVQSLKSEMELKLKETSLVEKERSELEAMVAEVTSMDLEVLGLAVQGTQGEVQSTDIDESEDNAKGKDVPEGFWGKTKAAFSSAGGFVKDQWTDVRDGEKWKTETGKNSLRAAGFGLTGAGLLIGAGILTYKGIKSLREKRRARKERKRLAKEQKNNPNQQNNSSTNQPSIIINTEGKEKSSKRKKALGWAGAILGLGAAGFWAYNNKEYVKGKVGDALGKNLSFEEALIKAQSDILNKPEEKGMVVEVNMNYNNSTEELESYGEKTKIDIKKKQIEGMGIKFEKYEHLLAAANIVNYLKRTFRGKCKNDSPFTRSGELSGDIQVNLADGKEVTGVTGEGKGWRYTGVAASAVLTTIVGIYSGNLKATAATGAISAAGGYFGGRHFDQKSTLNYIAPPLAKGIGMEKFMVYLNGLGVWTQGEQKLDDITESPLKDSIRSVVEKLKKMDLESKKKDDNQGARRQLDAIPDPKKPDQYIIRSYNWETKIEYKNNKIKLIEEKSDRNTINSDLNLEFDVEEGLMVANLTNEIKSIQAGQHSSKTPFTYKEASALWFSGIYAGLTNRIKTKEELLKMCPSLLNEKNMDNKYIPYLHSIRNRETNRSLRLK